MVSITVSKAWGNDIIGRIQVEACRCKENHVAIRVPINGFGLIGRLPFRNLMERSSEFEVVAIYGLSQIEMKVSLLKYDSVLGRFKGTVAHDEQSLIVN